MNFKKVTKIYIKERINGKIAKLADLVYKKTEIYFRCIDGDLYPLPKADLQMVPMSQKTLVQMVQDFGSEITAEKWQKLDSRLDPNSTERVYLVIEKEKTIMGFYCIKCGEFYDENTRCLFPAWDSNIYLFDAYTFIKHRNKGSQKFATLALLAEGQRLGFKTATVMVNSANKHSKTSVLKAGFKNRGAVHHLNVLIWKKNIYKEWSL